jgi:hypothetical protein
MASVCTRKEFLCYLAGSGALAIFGCSEDNPNQIGTGGGAGVGGTTGGTAGTGGSAAGTGGSSGTSTSAGTGGSMAGTGGSTAGTGGSAAGTGGSSGAPAGGAPAGGSGGSAGGVAGNVNEGGEAGEPAAGGTAGSGTAGSGTAGSGTGNSCSADIMAVIAGNHAPPGDHVLTIPIADIMAGVEKTYNARGNAMHDHFIKVTAADFTTLKSGGIVKKNSCSGGDHQFLLSCATTSMMPTAPTCEMSDMCSSTMDTVCPDPT